MKIPERPPGLKREGLRSNDMEAMLTTLLERRCERGVSGMAFAVFPPRTHTFRTNSAWPKGYAEAPLHVAASFWCRVKTDFFN